MLYVEIAYMYLNTHSHRYILTAILKRGHCLDRLRRKKKLKRKSDKVRFPVLWGTGFPLHEIGDKYAFNDEMSLSKLNRILKRHLGNNSSAGIQVGVDSEIHKILCLIGKAGIGLLLTHHT